MEKEYIGVLEIGENICYVSKDNNYLYYTFNVYDSTQHRVEIDHDFSLDENLQALVEILENKQALEEFVENKEAE